MNDTERYTNAMHAMQSGVALEMNHRTQPTDPKHLRVGVNTAMCDHAALVRLLMDKGIITNDEYLDAIANEMENEVKSYELRLGADLA